MSIDLKPKPIKMRFKQEKINRSSNSAFDDRKRPTTQNKALQGHFYLPVTTFNLDSLPKAEKERITKLFWNDYRN